MRRILVAALAVLLATALLGAAAEAKKFRYASGPKPAADTALAVVNNYLEPVVRPRGPRVPYTNLQVAEFVADSAIAGGLVGATLESGGRVVIAPAQDHPLNFVAEGALLKELSRRNVEVTVRRSPVPDDSLALLYAQAGDPLLEYSLASVRTTYLRFVGLLPGRVQLERQTQIQGALVMRDPGSSRVLWTNDVGLGLVDRFPRSRVTLVEDPRYPELKSELPQRNADKVIEPIIVVGVVGGLVALFFQNRP